MHEIEIELKQSSVTQPKSAKSAGQTPAGFIGKTFLENLDLPQSSPGANRSLSPESFCQYCKDSLKR